MLTQATLQQVFQVSFELAQDNYRAKCPFHNDNSPSFYIHKDDLIGHCFGCGISGRVDKLASEYLHVSLDNARLHLQITGEEVLANKIERASYVHLQEDYNYIPESWLAPFEKKVSKYVIHRGFDPKSRILQSVGSLYDPNTKRQVFPHRDREGRLLGCIGRSCREQDPKWLFYWDYKKGRALYEPFRLNPLRPTILVEGVFDVLWLYQTSSLVRSGAYNVVASLGTSITAEQLALLQSSGTEIILGHDNDDAGKSASSHVYQLLRGRVAVSFVEWPTGAGDWMDLGEYEVDELLSKRQNAVQLRLSGKGERLSCSCRKHAYEEKQRLWKNRRTS